MGQTARQLHDEDVRDRSILVDYLKDTRFWRTSGDIRAATGLRGSRVRQLAQTFPTLLVSSGEGYKLTDNATHGEILYCVQSLITRGEKIISRAAQLASKL